MKAEVIYMNYFLQGFGVFLGVVAGVAITLITQWITGKRKESQRVKNLKFEFELNIKRQPEARLNCRSAREGRYPGCERVRHNC